MPIARTTAHCTRRTKDHPKVWPDDPLGLEADILYEKVVFECIALHRKGVPFLIENPWSSRAWWLRCMRRLLGLPGVYLLKSCMCQFGTPYRKETGLLTNRLEFARLCNPCNCGLHEVRLEWSKTTAASRYPEQFAGTIVLIVLEAGWCSSRIPFPRAFKLVPYPAWLTFSKTG